MSKNQLIFSDFCDTIEATHVGDLNLRKKEYTTSHTHNFFEVFIVTEGSFLHHYNGKVVHLTVGMGQFVCPSMNHHFVAQEARKENVLRNIAMHPKVFKKLVSCTKYPIQKSFFEPFEVNEHLLYQLEYKTKKLKEEQNQDYKMYILESIMSDLNIYVFDDYQRYKHIPKWVQEVHDQMQKVEHLIEGLPKLLELSARSQEHVIRAFKKYYGQTPTDYINGLRLKESTRLLVETDWTIITISEKCGFNTLTYYNKVFKKHYEMTPSEYRQKNRKSIF